MQTTLTMSNGEGAHTVIELTERQSELREKFDIAMHDVFSAEGKPLTIPEASKDVFYDVWTSWKELDDNTKSQLRSTLEDGDLYPVFLEKWNSSHPADAAGHAEEYPDYTPKDTELLPSSDVLK